jgi:hypothetical protein
MESSAEFGLESRSKQEKARGKKERRPTASRKGMVLSEVLRMKNEARRKIHSHQNNTEG